MALNLGTLSAAVTLDDAEYRSKLSGLEGQSASTFKRIAQLAASYLTLRALLGFAGKAISTFSDLEEETNKFSVVFQGMGGETSRVLAEMRRDFGLSELAAKKMLAGTGDILTGFGFNREAALALSEGAAKLGADIASFSNYAGGAEGATQALTKAMLGETESAKMLGIVIRQDDDHYKDLIGQAQTTGVRIDALGKTFIASSEQQAKAVAALAMAYEQSPNAIGDFVRSQNSIANQTRILQNNLEQLFVTIGQDGSGVFQDMLQMANSLCKSYMELDPTTRSLVNSTAALTAAIGLLNFSGTLNAVNGLARSALAAAASQGVLAAATHGVTAAFTALNAALGPIGWAILALGAAYLSVKYLIDKENAALARNVELAQKNADAAKEHAAANEQQRREASTLMERLETLSKYERLNSAEQQEAKTAIEKLTAVYGDLGIRLDETTGKILIAAGAWNKLTEAQYNQAKQDLNAQQDTAQKLFGAYGQRAARTFENTKNSSRVDFIAFLDTLGLRSDEENLEALEKFRADSLAEGNDEAAADLKGMAEQYRAVIDARQKLVSLEEAHRNGRKQQTEEEQRRTSEELRRAQESFNDAKWKIEFDNAAPVKQARMLQEKIQKIFEKQSGKYGTLADFENADPAKMNAQELADLKQILELEEERRRIREESAEAFRGEEKRLSDRLYADARQRLFANQKAKYEQLQGPARARFAQGKADEYNQLGDAFQAQYKKALEAANADSFISKEEQSQLDKLFEKMELAFSDGERWADLARQAKEGKGASEREVRQSVGDWSLAALNAMLGGQNYNQQIADNTRRSITLEQEIARNTKNGGSGAAGIAYA